MHVSDLCIRSSPLLYFLFDRSIRPALFIHTAIKNYALVKTAFFANSNELGVRVEVVSKTARHVTLGSSGAQQEQEDPRGAFPRQLGLA